MGRACDLTFGNAIGQYPTADQLDYGWQVTEWMQTHAEALGVEYLIWQNKSAGRSRAIPRAGVHTTAAGCTTPTT